MSKFIKFGAVFFLVFLFIGTQKMYAQRYGFVNSGATYLKIGYFNPKDAKGGLILGGMLGSTVDESVDIGIGIDFRDVKMGIKDVLKGLDHFNLNELPAFENINPTSENIARFLYKELGKKLNTDSVKVSKVKVCETPGSGAFYWEE